jgi:threonine synthase
MKFKSTRGGVAGVSFQEAVLSGRPEDGGMFVPESLPAISREQLKAWSSLSYPQLVEKVLRICVDTEEISDQELKGEC